MYTVALPGYSGEEPLPKYALWRLVCTAMGIGVSARSAHSTHSMHSTHSTHSMDISQQQAAARPLLPLLLCRPSCLPPPT